MLKRLLESEPFIAFVSALASGYIRLVFRTSTLVRDPADTDTKLFGQHPQVLSIWHGQFMMLPIMKPKREAVVKAMVSRHGDAELIGEVLRRFGMELIRGAGAGKRKRNRGGATAMRETLRALESGATVVMTADVPPGPPGAQAPVSPRSARDRDAPSSPMPLPPAATSRCRPGAP